MLVGLAACLPEMTLVCTADRPEASAQTQRGEDRAAVHGGRHEHDPLRRDCGRPDRPPVYTGGQKQPLRIAPGNAPSQDSTRADRSPPNHPQSPFPTIPIQHRGAIQPAVPG